MPKDGSKEEVSLVPLQTSCDASLGSIPESECELVSFAEHVLTKELCLI